METMKNPSQIGIRQGSMSIMSSSTSDFEDAMDSLDSKCPMCVANEINRLALMEHFMFNNPHEAMQMHLAAIDLKMECRKRLDLIVEKVDDRWLHEKKKNIASEMVITLIDLGNCFWSISQIEKSKVAYESARLICRLMGIKSKLLETSLSNRLSKLRLLTDIESIHDGIYDETCAECIDSFERSMYIIKNTVSELKSAMNRLEGKK